MAGRSTAEGGSLRVLGVEGGGTKTEWAVVEAGGVVGRGMLPAANWRTVPRQAIERGLASLASAAGRVDRVGVFLAGCATAADRAGLREMVEGLWPGVAVAVGSDRESGFAAAFGDGDGIAVIAGTGSAVQGRKGDREARAGGWGQLLGDRGSGYDVAMRALRGCLEEYDLSGRITPLGRAVLARLGLNSFHDLVSWVAEADKLSVARLAPVVFEVARSDAAVAALVSDAAAHLARYAGAVANRLGMDAPRVRLLGGVFANHAEYRALFSGALVARLPAADVAWCGRSGAEGAAWLALAGAGGGGGGLPAPAPADGAGEAAGAVDLAGAATEQVHPGAAGIEGLGMRELVELFVGEEESVLSALRGAAGAIAAAAELVASALAAGGRLFYVGAGTSGRLGVLDASEVPPTFGVPAGVVQGILAGGAEALMHSVEGAEDHAEAGALAVAERGAGAGDVVCGIAASGRTPFVLGALAEARRRGAKTVLVACNPARPRVGTAWDAEVDLATGPELVAGSTRLKAGTATKVVLNILSTCAMIRMGRVREGLMVGVRASNEKLRDRAVRIVCRLAGVDAAEARARLERSGWDVGRAL